MNSALTPREIQSRIRAGESVDVVARAAGVSVDDLAGFSEPVLAEREHMAQLARSAQVRRDNGPTPQPLEQFVGIKMHRHGNPGDVVTWDAFRREDRVDRHWTVCISYRIDAVDRQALFDYDPKARYVSAETADARWLIDDQAPSQGLPSAQRDHNPDTEPTVELNDDLAIVRAVQDEEELPVIGDGSALQELYAAAAANDATSTGSGTDHDGLHEVDGVYDIVSNPRSDMDVLYDMLAGFDEDSVHVYGGLSSPVSPSDQELVDNNAEENGPVPESAEPDLPETGPKPDSLTQKVTEPTPKNKAPKTHQPKPTPPSSGKGPETVNGTAAPAADAEPEQRSSKSSSTGKPRPAATKKTTKHRKNHRANVPSWDEIMFGERHPNKD